MRLIEALEFQGDYVALKKMLKHRNKPYRVEGISRGGFNIYATASIGTFLPRSFGISGRISIKNTHANPLRLTFSAPLRVELVFFMIIALIMFISSVVQWDINAIWRMILSPLLVLWYWGGYRLQERSLLTEFKKTLTTTTEALF
ncbi:MAG: hypothetical protein ACRBFS_02500 [Aureispira sp.]